MRTPRPAPPMIRWREVLCQFFCETCMAAPGEPCRTYSGNPKWEAHACRTYLARAAHWEVLAS